MTCRQGERGQATIDYLAALLIVVAVLGGLLALGQARSSRTPPIDPISFLARRITPPPVPRARPQVRSAAPAVRPTRRPRPPDRRPLVEAPQWALR